MPGVRVVSYARALIAYAIAIAGGWTLAGVASTESPAPGPRRVTMVRPCVCEAPTAALVSVASALNAQAAEVAGLRRNCVLLPDDALRTRPSNVGTSPAIPYKRKGSK